MIRWPWAAAALSCALALPFPCDAQIPAPVHITDYSEVRQHELLPDDHSIPTEWRDAPHLMQQTYGGYWTVRIIVDVDGSIASAAVDAQHSAREHRENARTAAMRLRFRPFERDGRPVRAAFDVIFSGTPADYSGPPDRAFPADTDLSHVRIRLERTSCYGSCPSYQVEIDGAGNVQYRGVDSVLARGSHHWTIPQDHVRALLALFQRADYFKLAGYYRINATDLPTYITGLEIGGERKFVLD